MAVTSSKPDPNQAGQSRFTQLTKFMIDSAVVGYYFLYYLLKTRPELLDSGKPTLCLTDKPSCCLHGTQHCKEHTTAPASTPQTRSTPWVKDTAGSLSPTKQPPAWRSRTSETQNRQGSTSTTYVFQVGGVPRDCTNVPTTQGESKVTGLINGVKSVGAKVNPMNAVGYIMNSVRSVSLPRIPLPSFGKAKTADDQTKQTVSVPKPEAPQSIRQASSAASPVQSTTEKMEAAAKVVDYLHELPHQREPSYPAGLGMAGSTSSVATGGRPTFLSGVQEFGAAIAAQQQRTMQPISIQPFEPMSTSFLNKREIKVDTRPSVSPRAPSAERPPVRLRILSQEVHDIAAPPVPPHSNFMSTSTYNPQPNAPSVQMFASTGGSTALTTAQNTSNDFYFSPQPYQQSHDVHQTSSVSQTSRAWPPPSNAVDPVIEKDHHQIGAQRQFASWGTTGDEQEDTSHMNGDVLGEQARSCQDMARILQSELAEVDRRATTPVAPPPPPKNLSSHQSRARRSQSENRWQVQVQPTDQHERAPSVLADDVSFTHASRNPQGDTMDWQRATQHYGSSGGVTTTMFGPEKSREFSRLLLEESNGSGRGVQMFSKRRERADQWVVESQDRVNQVVGAVADAAARKEQELMSNMSHHAPFQPIQSSEPPTPMSFGSSTMFSPTSFLTSPHHHNLTAAPAPPPRQLFSPSAASRPFSPERGDGYNSTPKDWRSYSAQYGAR